MKKLLLILSALLIITSCEKQPYDPDDCGVIVEKKIYTKIRKPDDIIWWTVVVIPYRWTVFVKFENCTTEIDVTELQYNSRKFSEGVQYCLSNN